MSAANGNGWFAKLAAMLPKVPRAPLSMHNAKPKPSHSSSAESLARVCFLRAPRSMNLRGCFGITGIPFEANGTLWQKVVSWSLKVVS